MDYIEESDSIQNIEKSSMFFLNNFTKVQNTVSFT